jgi:hypothetical protein
MDVTSWQLAAAYAKKIAIETSPRATEIVLLTHTKSQLDHTSLAGHLGPGASKALSKGMRFSLDGGVTLCHATLRTFGYSARNSVVIAFYADEAMLETLDGKPGVAGIVAVPEFDGDIDQWINRWNPVVHGAKREATKPLIDDPVIVKALESLTAISNISYDVLHPRDKEHADGVFRILRAKGHILDREAIKSWAIRKGWKPGGADELSKVAAKVVKLKNKPSLGTLHDPHGRYERWRS